MKKDDGEDVSTIEIKKILKDLIANENKKKPVTDQVISVLLKGKRL